MKDNYPLVLIDGSSYLFRAYHALPKLMSTKGAHTGAIRGVISMIRKLMADYPQSHIAVVFDAKGKSFRNTLYPAYKENRAAMPDELREQIAPIQDIIRKMGLPLLIIDGVEADDVIGTLAEDATRRQMPVLISTGDKDMAQLVNPHITLINTMTDTMMDEAGVLEKFGVRPDQIIDYLALVGDTSDNIPGVPNCGPKTAVKWLAAHASVEGIISHAEEIKGKVGENLRNSLETLRLSYQLATIKLDVALDVTPDELVLTPPDAGALRQIFTEYEFRQWVDELRGDSESVVLDESTPTEYQTILSLDELARWIAILQAAPVFAFDTETTSLDYMQAELVGVSFSVKSGEAAYIPLAHAYLGVPEQLSREIVLGELRGLLEDPGKQKIGQNLKYDMSVLARYGIELRGVAFDTMLESYVLNSVATRHNMDDLALKYLGKSTIAFEEVAGKGAKQITFDQVEIEIASKYAAEDADITLQLHEALWPKLQALPSLQSVFEKIELPLVSVLSRIERNGVLLDSGLLNRQSAKLSQRLQELERDAFELAGEPFNLGSPKQLQTIFFEKLQLPVKKKTPKGQPSTAEDVLQELALDYPLPKVILEYRGLSKLKSTYTDQLPKQVNPGTGRIHTSYHQAVAATGRLSSTNPNLQNIPIRTEEGRQVRKAFIAAPGYQLIAADYSQIELRIMAHLSSDAGLLTAFAQGLDIHKATAAEVFGQSLDAVTADQRRSAKAINFGLIYGMSAFGLARQLSIGRGDAQSYIDLYFERYPGVLDYMDRTKALAAEQGFVETLFGRRLYLPEINTSNFQRRQGAERTAINAPMQGSAADIIKLAMIDVDRWLTTDKPDARMIMQVHDELVLEVKADQVVEVAAILTAKMSQAVELKVPLLVETGVGLNWEEAH
ncbi:MAG: DNA polymerase I [SAR86 cluster bacterium]|uniref:DNA polymerase I n=1 Tax=SAR86 cluster bacterium TaxID=2030880 RepID=A0A972VZB0_9GAMM|nr:DNA polymerase I [SAR86 cluster bacterium]|tara:strand:- start:197 stop:2890 length:2694 start_codon:yes stop_codon:yes gene_type:complete